MWSKEEWAEYRRKWRLAHREQVAEYGRRHYQKRKLKTTNFCIDCGKPISPKAKRCSQCQNRRNPYNRTPEIREKNRIARRKRWENTETKVADMQAMVMGQHIEPNKSEQRLMALLNEFFPHEWQFVGDGSFWVGELNPDFIPTDGRKLVIDLFSDYWHNRAGLPSYKTESGRIVLLNSYGYRGLVVWDNELKRKDTLRRKITEFVAP